MGLGGGPGLGGVPGQLLPGPTLLLRLFHIPDERVRRRVLAGGLAQRALPGRLRHLMSVHSRTSEKVFLPESDDGEFHRLVLIHRGGLIPAIVARRSNTCWIRSRIMLGPDHDQRFHGDKPLLRRAAKPRHSDPVRGPDHGRLLLLPHHPVPHRLVHLERYYADCCWSLPTKLRFRSLHATDRT